MQGKKRKASDESPSQMEVPDLEKKNDEEVSSGSREKATQDVAGDKEVVLGTPKKRPRTTELQKLQIGTQSPQMLRKLQIKHYAKKDSKKVGKAHVETRRASKEKVVEEKQLPPRAKIGDVKALKEKDDKRDDEGKRPPKKGAQNAQRYKLSILHHKFDIVNVYPEVVTN